MKPIDSTEFKEIAVNLLEAFAKVCEENNLRYLLEYGTLIGAIRHKGFIPWDDDIDISMPRCDYEKLIELTAKNPNIFGENFRLAHYKKLGYSVQKGFLNLCDVRTITRTPYRTEKFQYPCWIDIFPLDYMDGSIEKSNALRKELNAIQQSVRESMVPVKGSGLKPFLRKIKRSMEQKKIVKRFDEIEARIAQIPESDILTSYYGIVPCYMKAEMFDKYIYWDFERLKCRVPEDYDRRLTEIYGDYMTLPPKEQQITHGVDAYWI